MNKLAIVAASLLLIFGAALWYLASADWNGFVRSQIEIQGSKLTQTPVTVTDVKIHVNEGFGGIYGLAISNPQQYQNVNAMYVSEISLDIDSTTLGKQPVVLDAVKLINPQVFVELDSKGNNNIEQLLATINSQFDEHGEPKSTEPESKRKSDKPETRIVINNLELSGLVLTLDFTQVSGKTHNIEIPSVTLGNIGGEQGIPSSQLGAVIAKELLQAIITETDKQYGLQLKEKFNETKKQLLNKLKSKLMEIL
ncbi:hypothetical protein [Thalassotalea maritima]|uniref:hypothetical protein n=1 Tax=Thalassotalea maritima TaxID=3242416 RepID=UPI003527AFB4